MLTFPLQERSPPLNLLCSYKSVIVAQLCPTLCDPMGYTVHGILQARILEWVAFPFSRGSSQPRSNPGLLQADSLPAEQQEKPKNPGVGSLSLLQWIFPTQESNQGLLHCRQILYQLSCQGSPESTVGAKLFVPNTVWKDHIPVIPERIVIPWLAGVAKAWILLITKAGITFVLTWPNISPKLYLLPGSLDLVSVYFPSLVL